MQSRMAMGEAERRTWRRSFSMRPPVNNAIGARAFLPVLLMQRNVYSQVPPPPLLWSRDEHSFAPYDVRTTVLPGGTCLRIVAALSAFQASSSVPLNSLLGLTPFSGLSEFLSRNSDFFWQGILYASGYANKNVLNTTSSSLPFVKKNIEAGDGIKPVVVNSLNDIFRIFSVNMVNPSNQITLYRNQLVVRIKID